MAQTNRNTKGLKPAKKGEVRNPTGRPKGSLNTKTVLRQLLGIGITIKNPTNLDEAGRPVKEEMSVMQAMQLSMIGQVINKGNVNAYRELMDRWEGKPRQRIEMTGEDGDAIKYENQTEVDYSQLSTDALLQIVNAARSSDKQKPDKNTGKK